MHEELTNTNLYEAKQVRYSVTAVHPDGTEGYPAEFLVTVYPNLVLTISYDQTNTVCKGNPVNIEATVYGGASGNNGEGYSFIWDNGETTADIIVMPQTTSTYNLTITDELGRTSASSITVEVAPEPMANMLPDVSETPCEGFSPSYLSFTTDVEQYEIEWQGPGITAENQSDIIVYPSAAGRFSLSLIDLETGCDNSFEMNVQEILPLAVDITANETTTCQSLHPTIALTASPAGGVWSDNANADGSFTPDQLGLQTLVYTYVDEATACTFSNSIQVEVVAAELPVVTWSEEAQIDYFIGHEYIFCVDPIAEADQFYWMAENAIISTLESMPNCRSIVWNEAPETPTICVRYETQDACLSSEECLSNFNVSQQVVSTDNVKVGNLKIYPNPANDWLTLESDALETISIFDTRGELLFSKTLVNTTITEIDLDFLSNGLYYVMINHSVVKKLVVLK